MPIALEVAELWALKSGLLDDVDPAGIAAFEHRLGELAPEGSGSAVEHANGLSDFSRQLDAWVRQALHDLAGRPR